MRAGPEGLRLRPAYDSGVNVTDLSQDPRLGQVTQMLRTLSVADTPLQTMAAFAKYYWPLRPLGYMLSVSTRDLPRGRYRITREINIEEVLAGRQVPVPAEPWRTRELIPVREGGMLWEWIRDGAPKLIRGMRVENDPILGSTLAPYRSALIFPLFYGGAPVYWNLQFRREEDAFPAQDIEQAMIVGNLIGGNNSRLVLMEEIRTLNERLTVQLEEVARVQASLLPREKPDIPGLELATSYLTSDRAGGDYYDFLRFDEGRWGILIADVSGHGPAAATIMAMLRGILHCYSGADRSPDAVLRFANARLVEAGIEGTFVTAFFAVYDPATATLSYARAGHNPPLLKDGMTGAIRTLDGVGALPLGILDPLSLECDRLTLRPNDTLILYTDGITEARSGSGEMFGAERLDHALVKCSGQPDCVVDSIHGALFEHTGQRGRADDQTIVALRHVGVPAGGQRPEVRVSAPRVPAPA